MFLLLLVGSHIRLAFQQGRSKLNKILKAVPDSFEKVTSRKNKSPTFTNKNFLFIEENLYFSNLICKATNQKNQVTEK